MHTQTTRFWVVMGLLTMGVAAQADYNDGETYNIGFEIDSSVRVDWDAPGMATEFNLLAGGQIQGFLSAHYDSSVKIHGGSVRQHLEADGNSKIHLIGGAIRQDLAAYEDSRIIMDGGTIEWYARIFDDAQLVWSGGTIGGEIGLYGNSVLEIYGSDFALDGLPISGELKGLFGRLTGTLDDGSIINNDIHLYHQNTKIVLIPEPATVALLLLGAALINKL